MIPTKYVNLTNQEVMDKLAQLTAKRENGRCYFTDSAEAADIIQEAINRMEAFANLKNLFEKPAYAQMSLDIGADFKLELNLKVKN